MYFLHSFCIFVSTQNENEKIIPKTKKMMLVQNAEIIFQGANSVVYLVDDTQLNQKVAVKVMREDRPTTEQINTFFNEDEVIANLNIEGIRKIYRRETWDNKPAMVMEYLEGASWDKYFSDNPFNMRDFLKITIQTCHILGEIHKNNIIHKDINGRNIFIDTQAQVKIIDFGISTKINLKTRNLGNPEKLEGTLAYISPEQTGRMNRTVDYRTDLYSLGVVLYEVLTDRLPFVTADAMELVHAHLAQIPENPKKFNPRIPDVLAFIILKLLRKNAEDRYQSAFGLKADLEKCLKRLEEKGQIEEFELAQEDFSGKLQIPQKLYGRSDELGKMMDSFEQACQGSAEMLLVSGYSGVGKSALVHEIHRPITERRGYFIEGKFDQFQKNIPYFAWVQALKGFISNLLTENHAKLDYWRNKIMWAVGNNGRVLTDVFPDLELIIGEQPEVSDLGASEAQNRFNYIFQNFINAISRQEHPLVIFIDDWQWADSGSLNLLKLVLTNCNEDYLLIIAAYRDNEVGETHQFQMTLDELYEDEVKITNIELDNLTSGNLLDLLADTLGLEYSELEDLAQMMIEKTQGNAFFVNQMLKSLHEDNYLFFDFDKRRWSWDLEKIKALNITDNVVNLMANKIQKLEIGVQKVLQTAACIGNRFNKDFLYFIYKNTLHLADILVNDNLDIALREGLIIPLDNDYKFAHDRIQQAVYSLINEVDKKEIHLHIGRLLVKYLSDDEREVYIFDIINQMNLGDELIDNPEEKHFLASLNLSAGKKARDAGAYRPAFDYLSKSISLTPETTWQDKYDFSLDLYSQIVEAAFLKNEFVLTEKYIQAILHNAQTILDKKAAYEIMMQYHIAQGRQQKALDAGLEMIGLLDIEMRDIPPKRINVFNLYSLPEMKDEYKCAAMEIMDSIITPAWSSNPDLFRKITYTMVDLSIRYGNSASACVGYAFYGGLLCGDMGDIERGYQFGKLAVKLLDRYDAKFFRAKVDNLYISTVMHWKEPARALRKPYFEAIQVGLETGEVEFASYNIVESCHYHFLMGMELENLSNKFSKDFALVEQLNQEFHQNYLMPWQQMIANLIGNGKSTLILKGEFFDETFYLPRFIRDGQITLCFITYQAKYLLAFHLGEIELAYQNVIEAEKHIEGVVGMLHLPIHNFYYSLILLRKFYKTETQEEKTLLLAQVLKNQKILQNWTYHSPANHQHRFDLVQAELMKMAGQSLKAMDLYEKAIASANANKYLHEEALAYEFASQFYAQIGKERIAKTYMEDAHHKYQLWGANRKVEYLEFQYPQFLRGKTNSNQTVNTRNTTIMSGTSGGQQLDMHTIIKASQTLSGQVILSSLLEKMMKIVVENAGAEKGLLILPEGNRWFVEAEYYANEGDVKALQSIPIEQVDGNTDTPKLSSGLINYIIRTKETIVLHDAGSEKSVIGPNYVKKIGVKSVLCMPLMYKGELSGILYLENNLVTDAFTPDRLEILEILSTQITISIQNALLYENLEEKVNERTAEVMAQKEIIEKKNHDITSSINYAKRIQDATMPKVEKVKELIPDSFIFFRPRDIVSGDFYWITESEPEPIYEDFTQGELTQQVLKGYENSKIIFTAADCTGHGVPGAIMSMTGMHLFNEIVELKGITSPDKILYELHKGVRNALKQAETENRDGMDLVLCTIDKKERVVEYSGAKNSLIYIENGELIEIKADKMPIGGLQKEAERLFTKHIIKPKSDEPITFYMLSDGYQDQFGGEDGRKFMIKHLKTLLLQIHSKEMDEQKKILQDTFSDWVFGHKQTDDVLVVGFRV
ncbi:MAG: GAF domain-containing protein [Cytophagales bacterium]|nr:MAG: GAF domain-containing protein [Cytophagales bacterium]